MGENNHSGQLHLSQLEPSQRAKTMAFAALGVGIIALVAGVIAFKDQVWPAYLTAYFYFSSLALGGLFFAAINHIARAGWSVSIRRLAESFTAFIPVIIIGGVIMYFVGLDKLYMWADAEKMATDHLLHKKAAYLNKGFFLVRLLVFGGLMWFFAKKIIGGSLRQDQTGDESITNKAVPWSIGFILVFALGYSLFSVDMIMSLLPYWYSTIFGIYCFAGLFQATLAMLVLFMIWAKNSGAVRGYITSEHIHDVAKYLKGFTVFWAYIAFSQYMLIWYANIPEETEFYLMRSHGGWLQMGLALLVFRFIVPFLALLPRAAKRNEMHLKMVAGLILVMQYVDLHWLIYPNFFDHVSVGFIGLGIFAGFAGLFFIVVFHFFQKNKPVAVKDPRMHEALSHHVTY